MLLTVNDVEDETNICSYRVCQQGVKVVCFLVCNWSFETNSALSLVQTINSLLILVCQEELNSNPAYTETI